MIPLSYRSRSIRPNRWKQSARRLITRDDPGAAERGSGSSPATGLPLRGLDLEASGRAEVEPRHVRKTRPGGRRERRRLLVQWLVALTVLAATAVLLRGFVVSPYTVRSTSMVPTIQPGTSVVVVRPAFLTGSIEAGDVVVFHRPKRPTALMPATVRRISSSG